MSRTVAVSVDLTRGEVMLGSQSVCLERVDHSHRFRIAGGAVVRTVTFEERCRAVRNAVIARNPSRELIAGLRAIAIHGEADLVADAVILALAGGGELAPAFEECAVAAAQALGWGWAAVNEAPAIEVDRVLAVAHTPQEPDGWTRFVFSSQPPSDLDQTCSDMIERLLARGAERVEDTVPSGALSGSPVVLGPEKRSLGPELPASESTDTLVSARRGNEAVSKSLSFAGIVAKAISAVAPHRGAAAASARQREEPAETQLRSGASRARVLPSLRAPASASDKPGISARVQRPGEGSAPSPSAAESQSRPSSGSVSVPKVPQVFGGWRQMETPQTANWPPRVNVSLNAGGAASALHSGNLQRDWLSEIAQALADECDIRGIDA